MVCSLNSRAAANSCYGGGRTIRYGTPLGQRTLSEACVPQAYDKSATSTITAAEVLPRGPRGAVTSASTIRVEVTPPRPAPTPPTPPSLIHSPVYVQTALIKPKDAHPAGGAVSPARWSAAPPAEQERERAREEEEETDAKDGNSLIWALKQVDRSLDELESNPLPLQREIYEFSRGPVGTATSSALSTAAKVTVAATREAVKAAIPVGQWVVREGAKAAFSLMSRAVAEGAKQQQRGGGTGTTKIVVKKAKK